MDNQFDINPHVIRQLGEELVPDEMTALMELIKNAYDADASYVKIDINTEGIYTEEQLTYPTHKGYIVVEDSGIGMNDEAIEKSWLTISYSNKRAGADGIKKKTKKDRTPLGDKGLGRLSTQRLADNCEIFTTPEGGSNRYHVAFDWREFDKVQRLSQVPVQVEATPAGTTKGTKLVLTNLLSTEVWKGDRLETFKNKIVQVLTPFSEVRKFYVYVTVNGESIDVMKKLDIILSLCQSSYEFSFDGESLTVSGVIKPNKLGSVITELCKRIIKPLLKRTQVRNFRSISLLQRRKTNHILRQKKTVSSHSRKGFLSKTTWRGLHLWMVVNVTQVHFVEKSMILH